MKRKILKVLCKTAGVMCVLVPFWLMPLTIKETVNEGFWFFVFSFTLSSLVSLGFIRFGQLMLLDSVDFDD